METVEKLSVWRKLCFAAGAIPYDATNNVISLFFPMFLLEVAQIPPQYASVILLTGEVWDGVSDPLCGYLVNKTHTRFGKYRPWIFCSLPFFCAIYFCLWYVPDVTTEWKFAWYFLFYFLLQSVYTCHQIPYTSLNLAITNDQKERDSATAYRMATGAFATLVSAVIQGQLVNKYRRASQCGTSETVATPLDGEKWSYELGAIIGIVIAVVFSLIMVFGTREWRVPVARDTGNTGIWRDLRQVVTFKPFAMLCLISLTTWMIVSISRGNVGLFCTHALHLGNYFANFILTLIVAVIVSTPVWQKCLVRFGKKKTFVAGAIMYIPVLPSVMLVKDNVYIFYIIMAVAGISISCLFLLPWSMLPDALDEFYVKTGKRIDAIFCSIFVFLNKLGLGIGLAVSQGALALGGYKVGACTQPDSVGLTLRILLGPSLIVFLVVALVLLYLYPINEEKRAQIRMEMEMEVRLNVADTSETVMPPLLGEESKHECQGHKSTEDAIDV